MDKGKYLKIAGLVLAFLIATTTTKETVTTWNPK